MLLNGVWLPPPPRSVTVGDTTADWRRETRRVGARLPGEARDSYRDGLLPGSCAGWFKSKVIVNVGLVRYSTSGVGHSHRSPV